MVKLGAPVAALVGPLSQESERLNGRVAAGATVTMQPDQSIPSSQPGLPADKGAKQRSEAGGREPRPAHLSGTTDLGKPPDSHHRTFWLWVACLTGVDYFSTLGYQPSVAFEAAGALAPLATVVLVLVTLFGALPVYAHVAASSPNGQGSIGMLERLMHGWTAKLVVLALLGFAATDYVITKTLSAADAAVHAIHNPLWENVPQFIKSWGEDQQRMALTMLFLVILGASFMRGFKEGSAWPWLLSVPTCCSMRSCWLAAWRIWRPTRGYSIPGSSTSRPETGISRIHRSQDAIPGRSWRLACFCFPSWRWA